MNAVFYASFSGMLEALGQIFFIVAVAGFLVRKRIFPDEYLKGLSALAVNILLPSLIFANTITHFKPAEQTGWWILPIAGFAMAGMSLGIAALFFLRKIKTEKDLLPVSALQNSGYLILPIGQIVFHDRFEEFSLYVFLFIIGFNVVLWSAGKYLLAENSPENRKFKLKNLITPPLVANLLSVALVLVGIGHYVPQFIITPVALIGSATVPVATFILGATLGSISLRNLPPWHVIARVLFIKLILLAGITIFILYHSTLKFTNPLMCNLIILEAAAAPAANLIVMIRNYGGNRQKIGSLMLLSYAASLITMPFWVALWAVL